MGQGLSTPPEWRLRLENASKTFSSQVVLRDVALDVAAGELHGLVGQNGSGKSTLIKILAGYHQPDPGARGWINGEEFDVGSVQDAHRLGLRFVHQDLALVLELNAVDNIALGGGYQRRRYGTISWGAQRRVTRKALARLGVEIDIDVPLSKVAPVERTAVAIVRALAGWEEGTGVLVLDEPTASLHAVEVERLHRIVRDVCRQGAGVVYVSHRLDDVVAVADRVSVLREGEKVGTYDIDDVDAARLATLMVGRRVQTDRRATGPPGGEAGDVVLRATGLRGRWLEGIDLEVRRGEVVGIAGVLGSGREELPYALASAADADITGEIAINGHRLAHGAPRAAQRLGIGFVPADRGREAVVAPFVLRENLTLAGLGQVARASVIRPSAERRLIGEWMTKVDIVPRDPERPLPRFSGGNQQKVILGRVLSTSPKVLVLSEPTAGVDIGARDALYDLVRAEVAEEGLSVVVASSDAQDLVALCDRVVVLEDGRVVHELRGDEVTQAAITHAAEGTATPHPHRNGGGT